MSCSDYEIHVFADGVSLPRPQNITGCKGDTVRFSVTTTLTAPINCTWSIGTTQNVVWAGPYYDYTFDNTASNIIVHAAGQECTIGTGITAKGQDCIKCPPTCNTQTVQLPAGDIINLIDEVGKIYPIVGCSTVCKDNANIAAASIVKRSLKDRTKCRLDDMRVSIYNNRNGRSCISLTIANSPIRFVYATVGNNIKYVFDTTRC